MKTNDYLKRIDALFAEWKQRTTIRLSGQEAPRISFNEDGIVNPDAWFQLPERKRILFVLKETHDDGRENWSLTDFLNRDDFWKGRDRQIWRRAAEWTKGLLATDVQLPIEPYHRLEDADIQQQIQRIAVLNLKKSPGGNSAKSEEIAAYTASDIDLIEREIEIIDPYIILFGGTFEYFKQAYKKINLQMTDDLHCCHGMLAGRDRLFIDYWHPANRYPPIVMYYGITNIYQAGCARFQ